MRRRKVRSTPAFFNAIRPFVLRILRRMIAILYPLRGDGGNASRPAFFCQRQKKAFLGFRKKRRLCAWFVIADKNFRRASSGLTLRSLSAAAPALLHSYVGFSIRRLLPHRDGLPCRRPRGCWEERKPTHQRQRRSGLVNPCFARRKQKDAPKCAAVSSFGASKARFLL